MNFSEVNKNVLIPVMIRRDVLKSGGRGRESGRDGASCGAAG